MSEDIALDALHFLKNFPFRPHIKEERLREITPLKVWKPGNIILIHRKNGKNGNNR
jgi:hypothetical protein